jgi:hypothetical protein
MFNVNNCLLSFLEMSQLNLSITGIVAGDGNEHAQAIRGLQAIYADSRV